MLHHRPTPLLFLFRFAHTLPPPSLSTNNPTPYTERWLIPRMDLHFMTRDSGLPGGQWPPSALFDTTIFLGLILPWNHTVPQSTSTFTTTCTASWPNGTFPSAHTEFPCTSPTHRENITFSLSPYTGLGERKPELSFSLHVVSYIDYDEGVVSVTYFGGVDVTANQPSEETSWLTCLLGRPLDGMRCRLNGVASKRGQLDVEVKGSSVEGKGNGGT
ncbi:hypothetical protein FB567DRAFT_626519 [Paraphoma chrysanthemicola]|uniref:Uncharacterized protein n=1 Tax=Paraphoma chrysanthemicola TaxID=798071 RepID=A0A8K0RBA7_9PLEO|nr:hypothetical protein FB567DRAFT_626519 [Paraphoma chrysanthemicola]